MMLLTAKKIYAPATALPVDFVKPLSYDFRVLETVDDSGNVTKVSLQVQIMEHDETGIGLVKLAWTDVPRYRQDSSGTMMLKS
jgi:hypothetical protein